jgi:hypothetical protein
MSRLTVKSRYGTVSNEILNCEQLSFKAKGLYAFIQSKPDNWLFSSERIATQSKDGRDSVREGLRELETVGLLERVPVKDVLGKIVSYDYILYANLGEAVAAKADDGNAVDGFSVGGNAVPFSNIDSSKKDFSKKEIQNTGAQEIFSETAVVKPQEPVTVSSPLSVMFDIWMKNFPEYIQKAFVTDDHPALRKISVRLFGVEPSVVPPEKLKKDFSRFCKAVSQTWLKGKSLKIISNNYQEVMAALNDPQTPESIKIKLDAHKPPVMHNNQQPRIVLR